MKIKRILKQAIFDQYVIHHHQLLYHVIIVCVIAARLLLLLLLLLLLAHLFTNLFILYLFCGLDLYKVQPFQSSPHIRIYYCIPLKFVK